MAGTRGREDVSYAAALQFARSADAVHGERKAGGCGPGSALVFALLSLKLLEFCSGVKRGQRRVRRGDGLPASSWAGKWQRRITCLFRAFSAVRLHLPSGGSQDPAFWACLRPAWRGSPADYLCSGPAPRQCSLSWAGVSRTGRGLLKGVGGTDFSPENRLPPRLLSCQVVVLAAYSPPFNPLYLIPKRSMSKVLSGTGQTGQLGKGCQLSFYSYTLGNSSLSIWETLYRAFSC